MLLCIPKPLTPAFFNLFIGVRLAIESRDTNEQRVGSYSYLCYFEVEVYRVRT